MAWTRRVRRRVGWCQSCGHTAAEVGQKRLYLHHLMTVARLGLHDPAVMDEGNVLVVCNACHALFHPALRLDWNLAGFHRGAALGRVGR